jgi:hypothetical protein
MDVVDISEGDSVHAGDIIGRAGMTGDAMLLQVLMVVQNDANGLTLPKVPFKVMDPWPLLFDKDNADVYYLEVGSV